VDDLAGQPEVGLELAAPGGQVALEVEVDDVGGVEPKAVDAEVAIQLSTAPKRCSRTAGLPRLSFTRSKWPCQPS
jgi:hypothetical protein